MSEVGADYTRKDANMVASSEVVAPELLSGSPVYGFNKPTSGKLAVYSMSSLQGQVHFSRIWMYRRLQTGRSSGSRF